ncbi:hypothetical protein F4818DRAFT_396133, partial [Hypoxylon cercidicola]
HSFQKPKLAMVCLYSCVLSRSDSAHLSLYSERDPNVARRPASFTELRHWPDGLTTIVQAYRAQHRYARERGERGPFFLPMDVTCRCPGLGKASSNQLLFLLSSVSFGSCRIIYKKKNRLMTGDRRLHVYHQVGQMNG